MRSGIPKIETATRKWKEGGWGEGRLQEVLVSPFHLPFPSSLLFLSFLLSCHYGQLDKLFFNERNMC